METVVEEFARLPERIKASADRVRELQEQVSIELKVRNELIVQAVDEAGISQADVARAAGVKQPHVIRILAAAD